MCLRECIKCNKQAVTDVDLELFKKRATAKYGRENICKECVNKLNKTQTKAEAQRTRCKKWREENPNYFSDRHKQNPDYIKEWRKDNREQWLLTHANYQAKRRAAKKQAIPKWFDKEEVAYIYKLAKERNLEVDHIIPLAHDMVCGLHVQENLRCIPKELNMWKSNKLLNGVSNNSMGGSR